MCDYSLQSVASRPAKVGDKLVVKNFHLGTAGFGDAERDAENVAVCVLPGTELAFDKPACKVSVNWVTGFRETTFDTVARFRQINLNNPHMHHDALEFPSGETALLTDLKPDQTATVLQMPAAPRTEAEAKAQERLPVTV